MPSIDVFAFGRLLFLIMAGRRPLQGRRPSAIKAAAKNGILPDLVWPKGIPLLYESKALCQACLLVDPTRRPSMQEVQARLVELELWAEETGDATSVARERSEVLDCERGRVPRHRITYEYSQDPAAFSRASTLSEAASLALPQFAPTCTYMKERSVLHMLRGWNIAVDPHVCCSLHAALKELGLVLHHLRAKKCEHEFHPFADWQCPHCKVMVEQLQGARLETAGPVCSLCNLEGRMARSNDACNGQPSQGLSCSCTLDAQRVVMGL